MQKKQSALRGFTLIELLVVIAIIGILSAVVLASLNTARQKGSNAAVQSDLKSIQTQAAIYYSNNSSYGTATGETTITTTNVSSLPGVFGSPVIKNALSQALKRGGSGTSSYSIGLGGNSYAVAVSLQGGNWFCVDDSGTGTTTSAAPPLGGGTDPAKC